jgi:hypothetical protein
MIAKANIDERAGARVPFKMIEMRIWADEKFVKLSRAQPSAQFLFIYLFSGPHTLQPRMVPGVYRVSRAGLADALGWSLDDFDACFREISGLRMAEADWDHQILWLPNVLKRAMPRAPNNVVGWRSGWDLIPDCNLKRRIFRAIRSAVNAQGEAFSKAFDAAIRPVQLGSGQNPKKVKESKNEGGASPRHKAIHQRDMSPNMSEAKREHRPEHQRGIDPNIAEASTDTSPTHDPSQILDRRYKNNPNVKGVNGATAPLPPRTRMRARESGPTDVEPLPDKARSEFASVRRFTEHAEEPQTQRDLLEFDVGKPLSDKDFGGHPGVHERGMSSHDASAMSPAMPHAKPGRKPSKAAPDKAHGPDTGATWDAYATAFVARYGVEPVRNATVNAQMLHFVERIGAADAPDVARFYVASCSSAFYVKRCHAVGVLLTDAESLHTQWATHRPVTATEAAMADRTATNANAFGPLIAEARERERNEAQRGHD